jgi:hypothetical protein
MPSDRVRDLERQLARLAYCGNVELNYDMWDRWGAKHTTEEYRAEMERDIAEATKVRAEATALLEELVAKTRAEAPEEIAAWADAHDAYLAAFIADCKAKGDTDGTAAFVAEGERKEWAEVKAGTRTYVKENGYYVTVNHERYRKLFGIDRRTLERVD